jgi:hypothetical protein
VDKFHQPHQHRSYHCAAKEVEAVDTMGRRPVSEGEEMEVALEEEVDDMVPYLDRQTPVICSLFAQEHM